MDQRHKLKLDQDKFKHQDEVHHGECQNAPKCGTHRMKDLFIMACHHQGRGCSSITEEFFSAVPILRCASDLYSRLSVHIRCSWASIEPCQLTPGTKSGTNTVWVFVGFQLQGRPPIGSQLSASAFWLVNDHQPSYGAADGSFVSTHCGAFTLRLRRICRVIPRMLVL